MVKKYKEAQRNFKSSGNHEDFDKFVGTDDIVGPGIYYFHLALQETGDLFQSNQVNNCLPPGCLMSSCTYDDDSEKSHVKKRRKTSPTEDFRQSLLESRNKLTESFVLIGNERKRGNDRKEKMEKQNLQLKNMELAKGLNEQLLFLLNQNAD